MSARWEDLSDKDRAEITRFRERLEAESLPYRVACEAVLNRAVEAVKADEEYGSPRAWLDPLRAAVREMQRHDPRGTNPQEETS